MNGFIDKFNKWYDALQEPWRFLTALGLASVGIGLLATGKFVLSFLGFFWILFLLFVRVGEKF
jgi:hypothetical protein